jgi:CRISPR/Cas system CSM-associated protein Csm3 (group 7 of RAMP superfamily)
MTDSQTTRNGQANQKRRTVHRHLRERIIVTGDLILDSPAHFSNGDAADATDMPLLVDELDGRALITGASLAGALRNFLRERQCGYQEPMPSNDIQMPNYREWVEAEGGLMAVHLFGGHRGDEEGAQSPLIVDDAPSLTAGPPAVELRDGVKLDPRTRTAEDKKKYDLEILSAGARFRLNFELLLDDDGNKNTQRKQALAVALDALKRGEIHLGARKRRGFGRCRVEQWTVTAYDLKQKDGLLAWLLADYPSSDHPQWNFEGQPRVSNGPDIAALLKVDSPKDGAQQNAKDCVPQDRREWFEIEADFKLDGSLLIRSGFGEQDQGPDYVHLHTRSGAGEERRPTLPGTSLAGALRARSLRIANTLTGATYKEKAPDLINQMFGPEEIRGPADARASRVIVNEQLITGGQSFVQTRISIDRFTGGTMVGALLEEAPQFGGQIKLKLQLLLVPNDQAEAEIGLLLLVLKDLWLGDLPLGGESSVGRGRLQGQQATLRHKQLGQDCPAKFILRDGGNGAIKLDDEADYAKLERYVAALQDWARRPYDKEK